MNAADLLLAQIENVAAEVRDDIIRRESGPDVTSASVANAVYERTGWRLREREAGRFAELAHGAGVASSEEFATLIDPSGDEAAAFSGSFKSQRGRGPSPRELVEGILRAASGEGPPEPEVPVPLPPETDEDRARLDALLQAEPPENELDRLDPDVELEQPEE